MMLNPLLLYSAIVIVGVPYLYQYYSTPTPTIMNVLPKKTGKGGKERKDVGEKMKRSWEK